MFVDLTRGAELVYVDEHLIQVLRADGGYVTHRTRMTKSPNTEVTIDVNIPGYRRIKKIKLNP